MTPKESTAMKISKIEEKKKNWHKLKIETTTSPAWATKNVASKHQK